MKFLGVIAHLLHAVKAHIALAAHVDLSLMRNLLMLHQFFNPAELGPAHFAFVSLEHPITRCYSVCPNTSCTDSPALARPA
jgi:hypothetical protein